MNTPFGTLNHYRAFFEKGRTHRALRPSVSIWALGYWPKALPITACLCSGPLANPFASARLYGSVLAPDPKGLPVCTISVPVGLSPKGRSEATDLGSKDSPTINLVCGARLAGFFLTMSLSFGFSLPPCPCSLALKGTNSHKVRLTLVKNPYE